MIKNIESISICEAKEYVKNPKDTELGEFFKHFSKLDSKEAKELRQKLEGLNMLKLKRDTITKIIEILPQSKAELNKIFNDLTLDENEIKKILDVTKEFK
jgi:DNA-directed RNA polymerase subunit F